jgi:hypothetical protein
VERLRKCNFNNISGLGPRGSETQVVGMSSLPFPIHDNEMKAGVVIRWHRDCGEGECLAVHLTSSLW